MKSYLVMVDEFMAQQLHNLMPRLQLLEVQGMDVQGSNNLYKVLIAPVTMPLPQAPVQAPVEVPALPVEDMTPPAQPLD